MVNSIIDKMIPFAMVSFLNFNKPKNIPIFKMAPNEIILPNSPSNCKSCNPPMKE